MEGGFEEYALKFHIHFITSQDKLKYEKRHFNF